MIICTVISVEQLIYQLQSSLHSVSWVFIICFAHRSVTHFYCSYFIVNPWMIFSAVLTAAACLGSAGPVPSSSGPLGGSIMPHNRSPPSQSLTSLISLLCVRMCVCVCVCVCVCGWTVTWVVLEVSPWWLIHPEMTNTQTPQWTVITAIGAKVWLRTAY